MARGMERPGRQIDFSQVTTVSPGKGGDAAGFNEFSYFGCLHVCFLFLDGVFSSLFYVFRYIQWR